jgi:glycosyltransferase involved in cell wall biosynthesis/predicted O-methyltransferase YrrM
MVPVSKPISAASAWNDAAATSAEERVSGTASYLDVLNRLHRELLPAHYLEIGVRHGRSLILARGAATGVDPAPAIDSELPLTTKVVPLTSDDFFAAASDDLAPDFSFIDGRHFFEYALRDFINVERCAAPGAVVVIDDVFPNHAMQAERERQTGNWTGDVWRLVDVLRNFRPDLFLLPLDAAPAGLLLIAGLDPSNRVLSLNYDVIVRAAPDISGPPQNVLERRDAIDPTDKQLSRLIEILKATRQAGASPQETVAQLLTAQTDTHRLRARPSTAPKLSVVIVGYNMARELPRTIRSFSPVMQRGIDPRDYEVILIDNGSTQGTDATELRRFLPNLVMHKFADATVSPVPAINFGLALARGDLIGVCIDGARLASPGLLATALAASHLHARPMIGTVAFHLGSAVQMESVKHGYDQAVEDALLVQSGWENDGYRLFSISTFAGSSACGWFELPTESNALFLRAEHWRALGGWDERFVTPGGGLVNLDMWSRVCADFDGELIMLLGEATFHQVHGGIATNNLDPPGALFQEEYVRIRGSRRTRPTRSPIFFRSIFAQTIGLGAVPMKFSNMRTGQ